MMARAVNPALRRLGMAGDDRALIIHADDIGMCHATLPALAEVMAFGLVTSSAVMVPCPWFAAAAALYREHPEWDVGVHLTVTSEFAASRWGPVASRGPEGGLMDEEGYFPRQSPPVREQADLESLRAELDAQITQALAAGLDITHADQHMFTFSDTRLFPVYAEVALRRHVLPLLLRRRDYAGLGTSLQGADQLHAWVSEMEELRWPVFDSMKVLPLRDPEGQVAIMRMLIDRLGPGLHLIIAHPAVDTPELRALVPSWQARVANREALLSVGLQDYIRYSGVRLLSYRDLRRVAGKR